MKINEVVANNNDRIDEIFGIKRRMQQRRAFSSGKKRIAATADNLMNELATWLGSQGIRSYRQMDHDDLAAFFRTKKVGDDFIDNIDTNVPLNRRVVGDIITYAARVAATGRGGKPPVGIKTSYSNVDIAGVGQKPNQSTANNDSSAQKSDQETDTKEKFTTQRTVPTGTRVDSSNGKTYAWGGKTWLAVSPRGKITNQRAPNAIVPELEKKAKQMMLKSSQK